jgi:hypothetical protein
MTPSLQILIDTAQLADGPGWPVWETDEGMFRLHEEGGSLVVQFLPQRFKDIAGEGYWDSTAGEREHHEAECLLLEWDRVWLEEIWGWSVRRAMPRKRGYEIERDDGFMYGSKDGYAEEMDDGMYPSYAEALVAAVKAVIEEKKR